jgi:alpha-L-rhamnosidase
VDITAPRFSWQTQTDNRNFIQSAYEIEVSLDGKGIWSTGKSPSTQSILIPYAGPPLQSARRYQWRVRIWDSAGHVSPWSPIAFFQTALLSAADWKGLWIQPGYEEPAANRPSPLFRKEFGLGKKVKSAYAYITAHGIYEARINGRRIGDAYLAPCWTSYHHRLQYQVYDVTALVRQGTNAIGAMLGSGWWRGFIAFDGKHEFYGKDISLLMQVMITYADGSTQSIGTDETWKQKCFP